MRGNHYTGRPVDVVVDDVESYRWPTESIVARFEERLQVPRHVLATTTPGRTMTTR